jgi:hypothetical protein
MMEACGPINNKDISALIGLNIVALYRNLAGVLPIDLDASLVCCGCNRWDEVANFFRIGIHVDRTNPALNQVTKEFCGKPVSPHWKNVSRSAARREAPAKLWYRIARYDHWALLNRRIHEPYYLSRLAFLAR